jgi:N-acyl-L-homoserine lactone synthetase
MAANSITYGKFTFGLVEDEQILTDTFRMRHEVYVQEFGFERAEDHPNGLETDEYENESVHFACL